MFHHSSSEISAFVAICRFRWRVDDGPAGRAQSVAFAVEARDDPVLVGNLEETEAQDVWGARSLLIGGSAVSETLLRASHT